MAPAGELGYFPPLDKCFEGDDRLISWKTTFDILSTADPHAHQGNPAIDRHLSDKYTQSILAKPFDLFKKPSAETKSAFETKTSAINITPSKNGEYDIKEVKEDAQWLSGELQIDEISALRIVVLEWQTRAECRLANGFSEEETAALQDALGSSKFGASVLRPLRDTNSKASSSEISRRARLRTIYLSERLYALKVSQYLLNAALFGVPIQDASAPPGAKGKGKTKKTSWVERNGQPILEAQQNKPIFIAECVDACVARTQLLERGSQWHVDDPIRGEAEEVWGRNMLLELIHVMQIMFLHFDASPRLLSTDTVLKWFNLMNTCAFFDGFEPGVASPIAPNGSRPLYTPYFLDRANIGKLVEIFFAAAERSSTTAGPALFAFSIILQNMRMVAEDNKQAREEEDLHIGDEWSSPSDHDSLGSSPDASRRQAPHRNSLSLQRTLPEEILEMVQSHDSDIDVIEALARGAADFCRVFDVIAGLATRFCDRFNSGNGDDTGLRMRKNLLLLIRAGLDLMDYVPEVLAAVLSILSGSEPYQDSYNHPTEINASDPRLIFLRDDVLLDKLLKIAQTRFPYEATPFLKLCRALASCRLVDDECMPLIGLFLERLEFFTQAIPVGYTDYEPVREIENANLVHLTADIDMFPGKASRPPMRLQSGSQMALVPSAPENFDEFKLEEGTLGQVVSESKPLVITWKHQYSCFRYLGRFLEQYLANGFVTNDKIRFDDPEDVTIEIIGLLSTMLKTSVDASTKQSGPFGSVMAARKILEDASDGLDRTRDVVSVIFDIFEATMLRPQLRPGDSRTLDLLVVCLKFVRAVVPVVPGRVWPFLSRCSLLDMDGRGGKFNTIVASLEIPTGRYAFLSNFIGLYQSLLEDAITFTVLRNPKVNARARNERIESASTGAPVHVMGKILTALEQISLNVFESMPNWKFSDAEEKLRITSNIISIFKSILYYGFGVDDESEPASKVSSVINSGSAHAVETFLSTSRVGLPIDVLLQIVLESIDNPNSSLFVEPTRLWVSEVASSLELIESLIRVRKQFDLPFSRLESQLFKATPVLVRVYVTHYSYRSLVASLLEELVRSVATVEGNPPSLLGHLGPKTVMDFLEVLSHLDKPTEDESLQIGIWNLLAGIVSSRQRWLSICLLTGVTPKQSIEKKTNDASEIAKNKALLTIALDAVVSSSSMDSPVLPAMLEFISLAEEHWPWAMTDLHKHPKFLNAILNDLGTMKSIKPGKDFGADVKNGYSTRIAAFFADILATYIHHSRSLGDTSFVKKLSPHLQLFVNNGVAVSAYNTSLHANLAKNFEARFPNYKLHQFKRTISQKKPLGRDFYYDIPLMSKVLSFDPAWEGAKGQGFMEEFVRANINLSVVEAQVVSILPDPSIVLVLTLLKNLLQSWKFLAIELSFTVQEKELRTGLFKVANDCLVSNTENNLPEKFFQSLLLTRADLALALLQRLVKINGDEPDAASLLFNAWDAVRACGPNFELSFDNTNMDYYRCLLKILFLTLQFQLVDQTKKLAQLQKSTSTSRAIVPSTDSNISKVMQTVLEILTIVVGQGFRSLTSILHESPQKVLPADFALLTAILQVCLQMPRIELIYSPVVMQLVDSRIARYAITLFSWSDQLAIDGDPVYGELSILLLLALSTVPMMAEHLAVSGIISQISAAKLITIYRRNPGPKPFDQQPRLYAIWATGVVPLCLNLLHAIGAGLAGEIATFLNGFPSQLSRAAESFNPDVSPSADAPTMGCVSLTMVSEAQTLALISFILDTVRAAGPSAGIEPTQVPELAWDKGRLKEDIENFQRAGKSIKSRILPTTSREEALSRQKARHFDTGMENQLQEKVMEDLKGTLAILEGVSDV
ncbi:MAG: hypothetical protein M1834_005604 [Cirrosporium novae-zelandiae]|nr:MAG: hypothetical protein M1834_005604 [Cirrosporium novae-zelandiae]